MKVFTATVIISIVFASHIGSADNDGGIVQECEARCSTLDGENKTRCLSTCVRTKKRNAPPGGNAVRKRVNECEDACSSYTGLENVRCRRICLDLKREGTPVKKPAPIEKRDDGCEQRCGVLSSPMKEKCLVRCKKTADK